MPNVSANRLSAWGLKFDEQGNLDADRKPKSGTTITPNELAAVQDELTSGGRGQRKTTSLRKAQLTLASRGIKKGRETWRRALWQSGWRPKLSRRALPLEPWEMARRKVFFTKHQSSGLAAKAMFTDSKIFMGEPSSTGRLPVAWGPDGQSRTVGVKQHASYQVHAYAGITRDHGATKLILTKGTKGPSRDGPGRPPANAPP